VLWLATLYKIFLANTEQQHRIALYLQHSGSAHTLQLV